VNKLEACRAQLADIENTSRQLKKLQNERTKWQQQKKKLEELNNKSTTANPERPICYFRGWKERTTLYLLAIQSP
jgi:hypothetical protein